MKVLTLNSNKIIYVGCHEHPYKSYYNIAAGLVLHYKIPKVIAMQLSKDWEEMESHAGNLT